ncbi:MAG: insulinase family protein [Sandaracinaceae bacterium]|nr:insulinase family protein [Sandaracinaceae bacterium]
MRRPSTDPPDTRSCQPASRVAARAGRVSSTLALLLMAGCAGSHTTAPPTTPRVSPEDDDATPPYEPAFSWLVRPLPTRGAVRLVLYVDAGSRDSTPPQVATLAAYILAARLSTDSGASRVQPHVTPDATGYELECAAADVVRCAERLSGLLRPSSVSAAELANARRRLRDDRARAAGDETRGAQAAAVRALFGSAAAGLFPLGAAEHDEQATAAELQAFLTAHYGSQRALLLAEGDIDAGALDELGARIRRSPHAQRERAPRDLTGRAGVAVEVANANAAAAALLARDGEHARAVVQLLRDPAFVGEVATGAIDLTAFELRGGSVVLLTVPSTRATTSPDVTAAELATLALRASDAADAATWRSDAPRDSASTLPLEPPPRGWPGAGSIEALGERWAARQPGPAASATRVFTRGLVGLGVVVDGGRADALDAADPDAATRSAAEAALRDALARAEHGASPWLGRAPLEAAFALPSAPAEADAAALRRWDPVEATLPNGARLNVAVSPTGESGVLIAFDGGPGEDGEPLHGRTALAVAALAERCSRMLGALDGVQVATRFDADRVGLWFEDAGAGWARVTDVAARCALEHTPDDADLQDAKRAVLMELGPEGSDARMRAWVAAALSPAQPGRVAPLGSGERLDVVRLGDVTRALEQLRVGARTHLVAFVRAQPRRVARRAAPRLAALTAGESFEPTRSRALGDSPHAVAWLGATPDHARLIVAFRDPVSGDAGRGASPSQLGRAHAAALAGRLRSIGLDVVWVGGDGGAYGHWSAAAVETTLDALDALPARIEAALRPELPIASVLTELGRTPALTLRERALALLPPGPAAPPTPSAGPRYVVARPQGAEAMRRRGGR